MRRNQRSSRASKQNRAVSFAPQRKYSSRSYLHPIKSAIAKKVPWAWIVLFGFAMLLSTRHSPGLKQVHEDRASVARTFNPSQSIIQQLTDENVQVGTEDLSKVTDYETIDRAAALINYPGTSASQLAEVLSAYAKTDSEKARIIFAWITRNIAYDVPTFLSGQYRDVDPETVLKERKTVCSGYANLYQSLAKEMGLDTVVINGYAKGYGYTSGRELKVNHAWNGVKINGAWYLLDTTWGSGYVNGNTFTPSLNPHYFATSPPKFIVDHLPESEHWQLLSNPMTQEQYGSLPSIQPQYFLDDLKMVSHQKYLIESNGTTDIVLEAPQDVKVLANLKNNEGSLDQRYITIRQNGVYVYITVAPPTKGDYEVNIFSKRSYQQGSLAQAMSYGIRVN